MSEVPQQKRARLATSPPGEGLQLLAGSGQELGTAPDTSQLLLCEVAQQALQKYSLGVMRVPLKELGVSPLNRELSGSHVHGLGRRIVSVEGFVRYRYRQGWAHEPNPEDPLEVARNTNRVARATPLLPQVPMVPLKGSIAKTHLMAFQQCLEAGNIYWSDTKQLMTCPAGQLQLAEHLKYGMFYEVFSYAGVTNDKAAILSLCQADNFDSAFALGETEMQLLRSIHASLSIMRPPVGKSSWDVIKETAAVSCGQRWSEEDMIAIYNFAKVIGETHLKFLTETVAVHIPWDTLAVRPGDFHAAARISAGLPWLKVAMVTAQYFPPEGKTTAGPFGKSYGNLVPKGEWERLAKASAKSLMQTEAFLSYLANMYLKTEGVPAEKLAVEIPAAFMRTARALLLARDLERDDVDLEKVETILRQKLEPGPFPPRFTPVTAEERVAAAKAAGATAIKPDNLPALNFAEGAVVEDVTALARGKNLFLGCRVSTVRAVRGVKKGAQGKLVDLGREALVLWDEGALVDSEEGGQHERLIPIASVQTAVAAPEKPEVGKKVAAGAAPVQLPACMPWAKQTLEMAVEGLEQLVVGALYQMFACRSAGPDQVVIESEGSGRIFSNINVKPRGLIVLPHVRELAEGVAKSRPRKLATVKLPQVWVKVGETEYRYLLGAPPRQ